MMQTSRLSIYGMVLAFMMLAACSDDARTYRLGASSYEPTYIELSKALQAELHLRGDVNLDIIETEGSVDSLKKLQAGKLDFALVQGGFIFDDTGLLSVAAVGTEYLHIIVPAASDIRDLSDLAGKRIATGVAGTGSRMIVEHIIEAARFDPQIQLFSTKNESYHQQIIKDDTDAAVFVTDLRWDLGPELIKGSYRLVGVRSSDALAVRLMDMDSGITPQGVYGKNLSFPSTSIPTLTVRTHLLVRENIPDRIVTNLTETLFDYHVRRDARLTELTEIDARSGAKLSLHPAAENFYSRHEPITSDEFEIAGVLLATLIASIGAINFLWEWYNARRQARIEKQLVETLHENGQNTS